ncbi:Protein lsb5 [Lachnellula willkommii]|uniref:Protein lsb5 n=1 Tax=Lachnellula willkommii TaxID=215461 RepID=A0A559M3V2_9HELO|nr:Protein lsb5 [Lachnellula willkommii]
MIPFCSHDLDVNLLRPIRSKLASKPKEELGVRAAQISSGDVKTPALNRRIRELFNRVTKLTLLFVHQKKPYSAVTVSVENLTSEQYEEDDLSGIPDLVEAIKLQATGPAEAARAIRKKLKYGNVHRQIRALTLLDGLIQNAGARFQLTFADEMLLERLRVCGTSDLSDPLVRDKCKVLFRSWATEYKNVRGLERIAALYKELPRRKRVVTQDQSKVLRETEQNPFEDDEDEFPPPAPAPASAPGNSRNTSLSQLGQSSRTSNSIFNLSAPITASKKAAKKDKDKKGGKKKSKPFNLEAEKDTMKNCIAEASVASTNLLNALRLINREKEQISENQAAVHHFDICKLLRRKILRYIQLVEAEQWLGALLHANDELVTALMTFEQLDRSIDADSDSDDELAEQANLYNKVTSGKGKETDVSQQFAGLKIDRKGSSPEQRPPPPPRPAQPPPAADEGDDYPSEDEDDPFADRNELNTPAVEKDEPRW